MAAAHELEQLLLVERRRGREERQLWRRVYASLIVGKDMAGALAGADKAVEIYRQRFFKGKQE